MNLRLEHRFERAVRLSARDLAYPRTPDVASAVRAALASRRAAPPISLSSPGAPEDASLRALRREGRGSGTAVEGPAESAFRAPPHRSRDLAALRAMALLLIFAAALLAVPDARALISGWFRIGVINVMPSAPTHVSPAASRPVTATPSAPTDLPLALRDLSGLTTLERARQDSGFRIGLPAYPENLPDPDLVFYQPRLDLVILVWLDPNEPEVVRLSLFEILSSNPIVNKIDPTILAETDVNGHPALWLEGPYPLEIRTGEITWTRIVDGRSLVWESEGVTYRLESLLSLAESLKIAESVR